MLKIVKAILKSRGRTFAEFAGDLGMSRQSLHSALTRDARLSSVTKIAKALGVEPAGLLRAPAPLDPPPPDCTARCPHCGGIVELVKPRE